MRHNKIFEREGERERERGGGSCYTCNALCQKMQFVHACVVCLY